jgi:hypothetical protein
MTSLSSQIYFVRIYVPEVDDTNKAHVDAILPPLDLGAGDCLKVGFFSDQIIRNLLKQILEISPDGIWAKGKLFSKASTSERRAILGLSTFGSAATALKVFFNDLILNEFLFKLSPNFRKKSN